MNALIVWGNCQTAAIWEVLRKIPDVVSRWEVKHHPLGATEFERARNLEDFDGCEILLLQDLKDWNQHPRAGSLPSKINVVRFPFCYFGALWPFDAHQNGPDPAWEYGEGKHQFAFQDHLLGRLRVLEPDPERRFAVYRALDFDGLPDVARYAAYEEARLMRDDRRLGFGIGRYIVENYRNTRLFHAITHPTRDLFEHLINELLQKLELPGLGIGIYLEDFLSYFQVPVHPLVIDRLGLTWVNEFSRYNFQNGEKLTFEEYVRRYIAAYS